ncbi:MAG: mechanosensitive ion channel [Phycisphaeraceae bacterium]|nr:mechanosensitive ion channel [Phycisphaeraceae bacterium]
MEWFPSSLLLMNAGNGNGNDANGEAANGQEAAGPRPVDVDGVLAGDTDALMSVAVDYGLPLIWAIVILIVSLIVGKILAGMAVNSMNRAKVDQTLGRFFGRIIYYLVLVIGLTFALSKFGINITTFAAVLAAAGFAIGMALSGTLSNFASGAMLLIFRPFRVGDVVSVAGITAKVNEIELFTTTFDTPDNRRIIIPNGAIYGGNIENISHHAERRVDVNVGVEYSADLDQTREVLGRAAESLKEKMVEGEGRGYAVVLLDLGDSSVNWVVRFWCKAPDFWAVKDALTRAVKRHLDEAGLGIPFPQMDVHLKGQSPS